MQESVEITRKRQESLEMSQVYHFKANIRQSIRLVAADGAGIKGLEENLNII